jgi:hypothetical protein
LVVEVMSARGYPVEEDFDRRADDLSVEHAEVVQRYREARRIAEANAEGRVDTEDLRQAVTSYRALVKALLAGDGDATEADDVREDHDGTAYKRDMSAREQDNDNMTERETRA